MTTFWPIIYLAEALFTVCGALIIIIPRTSSSHDWIGGGDLSSSFRKSVLILACLNVVRNTCFTGIFQDFKTVSSLTHESTMMYSILSGIESFGNTFLMLLTPYLLQRRLSEFTNIVPGQNLMPWLKVILLLHVIGMLTSLYNPIFWELKRLGYAIGCIPVITTIRLFRRVTRSRRESQTTFQSVEVLECFTFIVRLISIMADTLGTEETLVTTSIRVSANFMSGTRTILHGIILNAMDEAHYFAEAHPPEPAPSNQPNNDVDNNVYDVESHKLVVKF